MYFFLVPLILGFTSNLASAFTSAYSRLWGERRGALVTFIFRNVLGIPVWAIGFLLAARAPSPGLFAPTTVTAAFGWLLVAAGGVVIVAALASIRWKAARPTTWDALVCSGLYAHVRHPIHTGTTLEFAGLLLLIPTGAVALACALGVVWVIIQTRLEEIDLLGRLPGYREYMDRVPRFLPHV